MSIFVLPPLIYAAVQWPTKARMTSQEKSAMLFNGFRSYIICTIIVLLGYAVLFYAKSLPDSWGVDRPIAFVIGQTVFGSLLFIPQLFIATTKEEEQKKKKKRK
jgi:sugar phosphate permease